MKTSEDMPCRVSADERVHQHSQAHADRVYAAHGAAAQSAWQAQLADDQSRLDDFTLETCAEECKALVAAILRGESDNAVLQRLAALRLHVADEAARLAEDSPAYHDLVWTIAEAGCCCSVL